MTDTQRMIIFCTWIRIILFTSLVGLNSLCAQTDCDDGFAQFLQKEGEYYRAITEHYRLYRTCDDTAQKIRFLRNIGLCYMQGEDYAGYIVFYNKYRSRFIADPDIESEMTLYHGESYYHQELYKKAIKILEYSSQSPDIKWTKDIKLLLGLSCARTFDWQSAVTMMEQIRDDSPAADNLARSLHNFKKLPERCPWIAGALSAVIPGAGYMYCNQKRTGLTALLVNGLFIWAIHDAIENEQYGIASAAGFLGIGWYLGNIKGSVDAAKRHNEHVRHEFIDRLLERQNMKQYLKRNLEE